MSTRATVWIRSDEADVSRFIYHHCDGYALDEGIDPVLEELKEWYVPEVVQAILDIDDTYREVDGVGWDSEYVYKIDVDERKMYKYHTGIGDWNDESGFEKRLTDLEDTFAYVKEEGKGKEKQVVEFDETTKAQVLHIQLMEIVKYACKWLDIGEVPGSEAEKIQKIFKLINQE